MNVLAQLNQLGQSIWYDYIRRQLLQSGQWNRLVAAGVSGITSNPTIFEKAIGGSDDYDAELLRLAEFTQDVSVLYDALAFEDIAAAADALRPVWERSLGRDGYASIEVSPELADDTAGTVREAHRIFARLGRPNVMVKVPATQAGIPAIRQLISDGVPVNVTLIFGLPMYDQVIEAYLTGLEERHHKGLPLHPVASVASFFVSRVDTLVDRLIAERGLDPGWQGKAAVANAKLAYQLFRQRFSDRRFAALEQAGARVQRPLWASTSTKNPAYPELLYVTELVGPDTVNTLPPATLEALMRYEGRLTVTVDQAVDAAKAHLDRLEASGISMSSVAQVLLNEGVESFANSFRTLRRGILDKRSRLYLAAHPPKWEPARPELASAFAQSLTEAKSARLGERLLARDLTLWPGPAEQLAASLGWITLPQWLQAQISTIEAFAQSVQREGFRDVVVLGMGGSSLISDVWTHSFPPAGLRLHVLDTTHPAAISRLASSLSMPHTLFLVCSKSGDTTETVLLYRFFWDLAAKTLGREPGAHFVAITDAETELAREAQERHFRHLFINPSDVGGRYSALSFFGMVPAALVGLDLNTILHRTQQLSEPDSKEDGVWLGTALGVAARMGRDKVTLWLPPSLAWFGDWLEQLLAESTGKDGRGLIPVAHEPALPAEDYGADRLFVRYRLAGQKDPRRDELREHLQTLGHPVIELVLADPYDLARECLRWELATAIAGHWLSINPFDQPNVQESKDNTKAMLARYQDEGRLPLPEADMVIQALSVRWHNLPTRPNSGLQDVWSAALAELSSSAYVAVMAYLDPSAEHWRILERLREVLARKTRRAVTVGFGPRFLHSTGQLHKGGPAAGLFIQLVDDAPPPLPIPETPWDFATVLRAQAAGDLAALARHGRRVVSFALQQHPRDQIEALTESLRRL